MLQPFRYNYPETSTTLRTTEAYAQGNRRPSSEDANAREARAERARRRTVRFEDEPPETARAVAPVHKPRVQIEEVPDEDAPQPASRSAPSEQPKVDVSNDPASLAPEHPFATARDATYAPPALRNFGAQSPKPPTQKKPEPAYRSLAPIYDSKHAQNVYRRALDAPVSLTHEELLALSPEIRQATREACSTRRVNSEPAMNQDVALPFADDPDMPAPQEYRPRTELFLNDMPANYKATVTAHSGTPGVVISDPVEQYLRDHPHDRNQPPRVPRVAIEASSIRAIDGTFKDGETISCLLDSGSVVCSMSDGAAHALGLAYDPTIQLQMESSNGAVTLTFGLARNVAVRIGEITAYLQFHVIPSPAYDILLGRPFDILLQSVVESFGDGTQTITLKDPNSGAMTTVPTVPRLPPQLVRNPSTNPHGAGFRDSRI